MAITKRKFTYPPANGMEERLEALYDLLYAQVHGTIPVIIHENPTVLPPEGRIEVQEPATVAPIPSIPATQTAPQPVPHTPGPPNSSQGQKRPPLPYQNRPKGRK